MENDLSIRKLQKCIRNIDNKKDLNDKYMLKLVEEVGELAEVIRKNKRMEEERSSKISRVGPYNYGFIFYSYFYLHKTLIIHHFSATFYINKFINIAYNKNIHLLNIKNIYFLRNDIL